MTQYKNCPIPSCNHPVDTSDGETDGHQYVRCSRDGCPFERLGPIPAWAWEEIMRVEDVNNSAESGKHHKWYSTGQPCPEGGKPGDWPYNY